MLRLLRYLGILIVLSMLTACETLTILASPCEPPPIPENLLQQCQEPPQLLDGELRTLYLQMIDDMRIWGKCIRDHDKLIEVVKYRETVCPKKNKPK